MSEDQIDTSTDTIAKQADRLRGLLVRVVARDPTLGRDMLTLRIPADPDHDADMILRDAERLLLRVAGERDSYKRNLAALSEFYDKRVTELLDANNREVERRRALRGALERWLLYGCPDCSGDCSSANPPVAACIMRESIEAIQGRSST